MCVKLTIRLIEVHAPSIVLCGSCPFQSSKPRLWWLLKKYLLWSYGLTQCLHEQLWWVRLCTVDWRMKKNVIGLKKFSLGSWEGGFICNSHNIHIYNSYYSINFPCLFFSRLMQMVTVWIAWNDCNDWDDRNDLNEQYLQNDWNDWMTGVTVISGTTGITGMTG